LENGKSFVIRAEGVSDQNVYIQSAALNGKPYNKSFIRHDDLMGGGELVVRMGSRPNVHWGIGIGNEPVSRIDAPEFVQVPVIKAAGQTFRGRLRISFDAIEGNVYYTTDGSEPDGRSQKFTAPFLITGDTTVKAVAIAPYGRPSQVATARYHR